MAATTSSFDIIHPGLKNAPPAVAPRRLRTLVGSFPQQRVMVLGDLMLDEYIRGKVSRISPEAPVPVVRVTSETHVPGGAGNVCANLAALGAQVSVVSVVGTDPAAGHLLADLRARGMDCSGILQDPERPTTQKCRIIGEHQQLLRFDRETTHALGRALHGRLIDTVEESVSQCDGLIISDYGKGVVTPETFRRAVRAAKRKGIPVTVDPKVEHFRRYKGVDCITPNTTEAFGGMRLLPQDGDEAVHALGRRILSLLRLRSVLITRGEKGMTLFEHRAGGMKISHIPAQSQEVFDVTGAGDTVISVLTLGLAAGGSLVESSLLANKSAGIVVGKLGTATVSPKELLGALGGR